METQNPTTPIPVSITVAAAQREPHMHECVRHIGEGGTTTTPPQTTSEQ